MEMNIYFAGGCFWGTEHYISQFMGVTVPEVRRVAKRFRNCSFDLLDAPGSRQEGRILLAGIPGSLLHDHASHYAEVLNRKIIIGSP